MLSCKHVTELVSQSQDRELSLTEQVALKLHLTVCAGCRNFESQMDLIRRAFQRLSRGEAPLDDREP
ncbi:MAG TPA: zf-HC2 domain-containing protein [Burkholderiales bacterium]|nr:zf-HC2 domain-containing protein [Burkholderiales bacterium]